MRKFLSLILISAVTVFLAGCVTTDPCVGFRPIHPSVKDVFAPASGGMPSTDAQILAHNEFGLQHCGWKRGQ